MLKVLILAVYSEFNTSSSRYTPALAACQMPLSASQGSWHLSGWRTCATTCKVLGNLESAIQRAAQAHECL